MTGGGAGQSVSEEESAVRENQEKIVKRAHNPMSGVRIRTLSELLFDIRPTKVIEAKPTHWGSR